MPRLKFCHQDSPVILGTELGVVDLVEGSGMEAHVVVLPVEGGEGRGPRSR